MNPKGNTGDDGKRRTILVICLSVFISLVGIGIVVPLFAIFADDLGASAFWIGMVFSAFAISRTLFMPYFGKLSDRCEKKFLIAGGLLAYAFISFGYIAIESVEGLIFVRFLHGIASAAIAPVAMAYLGEVSRTGEEAAIMSKYQASIFFGFGAGPLIGGVVYSAFGYDAAFFCLGVFSILAFGTIVVLLPRSEKKEAERFAPEGKSAIKNPHVWKQLLANRTITAIFLLTFILETGFTSLFAFLPLYVAYLGMGAAVAGILISVNVFLSGFLQMFFGRIADNRRRIYLIPAGSAVFGISLASVIFADSITALLLIAVVNAGGSLLILPAVNALMVEAGRETGMGATMGAYNAVRGTGNIAAPLIGGIIIDAAGLGSMFLASGILILLGGTLFFLFRENKKGLIKAGS